MYRLFLPQCTRCLNICNMGKALSRRETWINKMSALTRLQNIFIFRRSIWRKGRESFFFSSSLLERNMWNRSLDKRFCFSDKQFLLKAIFWVQILNFRSCILSWVLELFLKNFSFYQEKGLTCIKATFTPMYIQALFPAKTPLHGKSIDQGIEALSSMNTDHKM